MTKNNQYTSNNTQYKSEYQKSPNKYNEQKGYSPSKFTSPKKYFSPKWKGSGSPRPPSTPPSKSWLHQETNTSLKSCYNTTDEANNHAPAKDVHPVDITDTTIPKSTSNSNSIREVIMGKRTGKSMIIPMVVNGVCTDAIVDVGAQVTVINPQQYAKLGKIDEACENVKLRTAA